MEEAANDENAPFVKQAYELWITPEIERRRSEGQLPEGFVLERVQILWSVDWESPKVRLNDEVVAVLRVRTTRPIAAGEVVRADAFNAIEDMELTTQDPNAAHFTMIQHRGTWWMKYDFRYNAARITEHLIAAREFLDGASDALSQGRRRVFCENLFAAVELMVKASLMIHPDDGVLKTKDHGVLWRQYEGWGELGNADRTFVHLLKGVVALRPAARYLRKELKLSERGADEMLSAAQQMFEAIRAVAPRRSSPLVAA